MNYNVYGVKGVHLLLLAYREGQTKTGTSLPATRSRHVTHV